MDFSVAAKRAQRALHVLDRLRVAKLDGDVVHPLAPPEDQGHPEGLQAIVGAGGTGSEEKP